MKFKFCVLLAALSCCAAHTLTAQFLPEKIIAGSEISFNQLHSADINSDGDQDLVLAEDGFPVMYFLQLVTGEKVMDVEKFVKE